MPFLLLLLAAVLSACDSPTQPSVTDDLRSKSVVLFATPKIISDFSNPDADVARFLDHYAPLTTKAAETIVIFAVGNSDHILRYRGPDYWADELEWARWIHHETHWEPVSEETMNFSQIAEIVSSFKRRANETGVNLKVFDQIDKGREFAHVHWKFSRHIECMDIEWDAYNLRGQLTYDPWIYASAPNGIAEGTSCGTFLVDQVGHYMRDLDFDGILYGNQLGTRGAWLPDNGPGYSTEEAASIRDFLEYSQQVYGDKSLMWFDSYNTTEIEHDTYSFPSDGYQFFDYIMAAGFAVVSFPERYIDNLNSKLEIGGNTKILATLDYVDPWYVYDSMVDFPEESIGLEQIAIEYRDRVDGVVFFANDEYGTPAPRERIEAFAERFWSAQ